MSGYLSQMKSDCFRPKAAIRWVFLFLTTGLVFLGGVIIPAEDNRSGAGQANLDFHTQKIIWSKSLRGLSYL